MPHIEASSSAAADIPRREAKQDDVVVTEPFTRERSRIIRDEYPFRGTPRMILGVMTIDDKWRGRRYLVTPRIIRALRSLFMPRKPINQRQ